MSVKKKEEELLEQEQKQTGSYAQMRDELLEGLLHAEPFAFDLNADALYRQYRDAYTRQGLAGARNAYAGAAALTGGYANSYAESVSAQTYNSYMDMLNERGTEIYDAAYKRHTDANSDRLALIRLLNGLDSEEYDRQQDEKKAQKEAEQTAYDRQQDEKKAQKEAEQTAYDRLQDEKEQQRKDEKEQYDRDKDAYEAQQAKQKTDYDFAFKMAQLGDFSYLKKLGADVSVLEKEAAAKENAPEKISVTIQNTAEETYCYYGYYSLVRYLDRQIAYGQLTEKGKKQIITALTSGSLW